MTTQDISRSAFDARKQYDSVRMQQGRVLLDEDWNANERIKNEALRRSRVEIIGAAGSPDGGFRITNPRIVSTDQIDFDIGAGSFYLGGLRLEMHEAQTYLLQKDWLQEISRLNHAPTAGQVDLAVLFTYQRSVDYVQDRELVEVALGGADTTTRWRTMQRVRLVSGVNADSCEEAWQNWLSSGDTIGTLNGEHELISDATLTVTFASEGAPDDLYTPTAAGGYLGAENQAIRVQLLENNHFTWGFDNAAPLYRVQAESGSNPTKLTLLTEPKDQAHWPMAEQVVEVLPWAAVLPNNEKVSEVRGHLTRVAASYNPDTAEITLADPIPTAGFTDWEERDDEAALREGGEYYYLRVWNRGSDRTSPTAIPFEPGTDAAPGTPVALGQTGLEVTFMGTQFRPADYWIIAARPETPHRVVPWDLESVSGRPPHGLRIFMAPLALIRWPAAPNDQPQVEDCRPHFRPLVELENCCTYTVGNGSTSHGDFDSLEEAVQRLSASGGKICLLPGLHRANVVINNRTNIKISGCDKDTRIIPRVNRGQEPIFRIIDSQHITLEHLDVVTTMGSAVVATGSEPGLLRQILIHHNRFLASINAIRVVQGENVEIAFNLIRMLDIADSDVAIYLLADDARVERNDIGVVASDITPPSDPDGDDDDPRDPTGPCPDEEAFFLDIKYLTNYVNNLWIYPLHGFFPENPYQALGGIQIGSGSERVKVVDNQISGGGGNGITLGSDPEISDNLPSAPVPATPADDEIFHLDHEIRVIHGFVTDGNSLVDEVMVTLSGTETLTNISKKTNGNGLFDVEAKPDRYEVQVDGYRVIAVEPPVGADRPIHQILVAKVDREIQPLDVLAFIYDVSIDRNEISNMGLSGIGIPRISQEELDAARSGSNIRGIDRSNLALFANNLKMFGALVGFVVNLQIRNNHIFGCLLNGFDLESEDTGARIRGVGGISLGLCEDLVIGENRIENNGQSYRGPAHGIFVIYANQLEVSGNHILNNGPSTVRTLQQGQTGGITIYAAHAGLSVEKHSGAQLNRQAARIHDNLVEQPVGRALTINALGPASIVNNQFSTSSAVGGREIAIPIGFSTNPLAALSNISTSAGAVAVRNLGMAGVAQQRDRLVSCDEDRPPDNQWPAPPLPIGTIMFNNNQVRMGSANGSPVFQVIISLDDISFSNNQSDVFSGEALAANVILFGMTVRASSNRLQEPIFWQQDCNPNQAPLRRSMLTLAYLMNNTTNNEGNHCIKVICNLRRVSQGNLALIMTEKDCQERPGGSVDFERFTAERYDTIVRT